ncbi:MAG: lycopene cyclase domain-containing protein [Candidatus Levybacteria bacterium]|nr:lycopene cyclase domain-containing protein [Candidatus Levybacteria bacterium]
MPEYLIILILVFLVTVLLHFYFKIKIYKSPKHFIIFNSINVFLATIWDQIAIARGHWTFSKEFLLGPKIGFMPIEEFLFVLILSYFALTFYKIIEKKI